MFGSLRKIIAVAASVGGILFATGAQAAPIVTVALPTVQLVAPAPPVVVVTSPHRVWVPGFVRYDAYGNPVHVAGYWTTKTVTTRRVVSKPVVRTVTTTRSAPRTVVVRR